MPKIWVILNLIKLPKNISICVNSPNLVTLAIVNIDTYIIGMYILLQNFGELSKYIGTSNSIVNF
jgi:hypothetical protein